MSKLPWHAGELALQTRAGVLAKMDAIGRRFIRDHMPDQHREFFAQLPFIVLGTVASDGRPWATLRAGHPGFLNSPDARTLDLAIAREAADPADAGLADGSQIGVLGIDLATRRRNRMNGVLHGAPGKAAHIEVVHSFGNCPRYIQQRSVVLTRDPARATAIAPRLMDTLDDAARALIARSDTFFVASYADLEGEGRQVDVSHRGGKPGFVRVDADGGMTIPDFAGNLFFNTLGNFLINPLAGITFVDFGTGELLQMSGRAEVIMDSPEIAAFQGAERLWRFFPERIVRRDDALPLRWADKEDGAAPSSLLTGSWDEAAERLRAAELAETWRPFRVTQIVDESRVIRSFHLAPADGAGRIRHQAGQFLPIRVTPADGGAPLTRTYTLSVAPSDAAYRISVKREGAVSRHLHEHVKVGDIIEARAPAGAFVIDAAEQRPAVLLAAGIGVTPMLAMLRHIVYEGQRKQRTRPTWFFYSARSAQDRAFADELSMLQSQGQGAIRVVRLLSDPDGARQDEDYDVAGRIDADVLRKFLPFGGYDFYLCGPNTFMQSLYDVLRGLDVPDGRIHAEAFGQSSLVRQGEAPAQALGEPATQSVPVLFTQSAKEARWTPGKGSLLELAEERGLTPEFSCREGTCGTCRTRVLAGSVAYPKAPAFSVPEGEALVCCAVPAANSPSLQLEL